MGKYTPNCPGCGEESTYLDKHDTYFCGGCRRWTEDVCECGDCPFPPRPDEPPLMEARGS